MPGNNEADVSTDQEKDAVSYDTFSGLRNTVTRERLGPRELSRATNVDLDDAGQLHRRRGFVRKVLGNWHSIYQISETEALGVQNGTLVHVGPDYSTTALLANVGNDPISFDRVGPVIYGTSTRVSFQIDVATLSVSTWGRIEGPNYYPGLVPAPDDFWFSPIVNPEPSAGLGSVYGKLLGAPPLGSYCCYFNGRMYVASGNMLWGTELFLYNYVDKNRGYKLYEAPITGLSAVADGLYVGTEDGLYFVQGSFEDGRRIKKVKGSVVPRTMIQVPGEVLSPEGRRRPDIPQQSNVAMACMMNEGQVVGLVGGDVYNLTRTNFIFPRAARGAALYREMDGMKQIVTTLDSGGTPKDNARIGDWCDATIIRAAATERPNDSGLATIGKEPDVGVATPSSVQDETIVLDP